MEVRGEPSAAQFRSVLVHNYEGEVPRDIVWDVRSGSAGALDTRSVRTMAELIRDRARLRVGGRTAVIAPRDLDYGVSRMVESRVMAMRLPITYQTFRTVEEALAAVELPRERFEALLAAAMPLEVPREPLR